MRARMRTLKTSEAAALLNVSPNTLRAWERRFGYPKPQRSAGRHRLYTHGEVAALRDALQQGLSISSAVSRAREALSTDTHTLVGALAGFELDRADSAMECALALRSVERSVEEVLLPSLDELGQRFGTDSAPWAFAARWADGWLRRAQRLAPPPVAAARDPRRRRDAQRARSRRARHARVRAVLRPRRRARHGAAGRERRRARRRRRLACRPTPSSSRAATSPTTTSRAGPTASAPRPASCRPPSSAARVTSANVRSAAGARVLPDTPFAAQRQLLALIDDRRDERFGEVADAPAASGQAASVVRRRHEEAPRRPPARRSTSAASSSCPSAGTAGCRPAPSVESTGSRVCGHCGLGLVLQAPTRRRARAPTSRSSSSTRRSRCAPCPRAPRSSSAPTRPLAVNRHIADFIVPADANAPSAENLLVLLVDAASGSGEPRTAVVRPRSEFGVRFRARIGPCGPPHAALLVLTRLKVRTLFRDETRTGAACASARARSGRAAPPPR